MGRRLAIEIHFSNSERSWLYSYFRYYKSLKATAKFCNFLLSEKHDSYIISRSAVKAWLQAVHPDMLSAIREQLAVEREMRKANKPPERPKEEFHAQEWVDAIRGDR
jgi:hypothetical protein